MLRGSQQRTQLGRPPFSRVFRIFSVSHLILSNLCAAAAEHVGGFFSSSFCLTITAESRRGAPLSIVYTTDKNLRSFDDFKDPETRAKYTSMTFDHFRLE